MKQLLGAMARAGLGLVLLAAGLLKGADPSEFVRQVGSYGIVTGIGATALAYLLVMTEVGLGVALLAGYRARGSSAAGSTLMVLFMAATAYAWAHGRTDDCGCFGSLASRTPGEVLVEDAGFLTLGILGFFLATKEPSRGRWRGAAVAAGVIAAAVFSLAAYSLPIDPVVTALRVGRSVSDLPLRESPVDLATGDHLVALLDLDSPQAGAVVRRLNELAGSQGLPAVIAFYGGEVDEKTVFCFNYNPRFEVVPVLRADLKRLFRKLPRFFLIRNGRVARIWDGTPPGREELL
jgi:uncharacterized membrane protein YphA (DoxX/SURF4 family)